MTQNIPLRKNKDTNYKGMKGKWGSKKTGTPSLPPAQI